LRRVKLKDIAEINPRKSEIDKDKVEQVSFVAMADVSEEGFISNHENCPLSEVYKSYTYFKRNDVLLAKITPCFENGKAAIADNIPNEIGFGSSEFHVLRTNGEALPKYIFYALWNEPFRKHGSKKMTGSAGQKRVPTNFLKSYEIPLPSLSEQKAIVTKLDCAQRLIDIDREMRTKYDELIQSVFLEMFGDPVRNEKGFDKGTIRDIVSETKYGTNKKAHETEGEYPVIRMGNLLYNGEWDFSDMKYCDLEEKELPKYLVHKGDVLFNRTNSKELVGKTGVYREEEPIAYAGYLIRVRPNEKATSEYISGYLNCPHGKLVLEHMCKNIVGMANINAQELQDIKILIPPIELQKEYEQKVNEIRKQKGIIESEMIKSEELFSSLVQGVFG